jgi:hypothetical protein
MSEEINNEDALEQQEVLPAKLEDGEPVISKESAEQFKAVIEEIQNSAKISAEEPTAENIITNKKQNISAGDSTVSSITAVANGVIGAGRVAKSPKPADPKSKPKVEKVAIHSTKNVTWGPVGKVYKGYNLVTPDQAKMWLTRDHTRTATPEEVAREFGK